MSYAKLVIILHSVFVTVKYCYQIFARPWKSARTAAAALAPSSIAPSMKLRHPDAQSEQAKKTLP